LKEHDGEEAGEDAGSGDLVRGHGGDVRRMGEQA
jgi:hypothetical protein